MRGKYTLIIAFIITCLFVSHRSAAQALDTQDSLALVDLFTHTGGPDWVEHTKWLTPEPAGSWLGVTVSGGRVTQLILPYNNLTGSLQPKYW